MAIFPNLIVRDLRLNLEKISHSRTASLTGNARSEMHFSMEVGFFRILLLSRSEPSRSKTEEF